MATIDELASSRNWFRGDPNLPFTAVLDAYMADSLDLPTTVTKLAQPINEKYSSGDAGADDGMPIQPTWGLKIKLLTG